MTTAFEKLQYEMEHGGRCPETTEEFEARERAEMESRDADRIARIKRDAAHLTAEDAKAIADAYEARRNAEWEQSGGKCKAPLVPCIWETPEVAAAWYRLGYCTYGGEPFTPSV